MTSFTVLFIYYIKAYLPETETLGYFLRKKHFLKKLYETVTCHGDFFDFVLWAN